MRKAMMYLLLALGITLVVLFAGGALIGFAAGIIDGFNESKPGTTNSLSLMTFGGILIALVLSLVLHWVFLHFGFASYSAGRIPKPLRWKVLLGVMMAMGGLALLCCVIYNPIVPYDGTMLTESDDSVRSAYTWMKTHPIQSLLVIAAIEMTANLVLYGAVLRELLEWKHYPIVIVNVYALVMTLLSGLFSNPLLMIPSLITAQVEAWTYEYSRSIIPVIVGDIFYWIVMLSLMGISFSGLWYLVACIIVVPGIFLAMKVMEPYKPIDN
jgi:amino acid transporter